MTAAPDLARAKRVRQPKLAPVAVAALPHDDESEQAVIGAALADPSLAPELRPEWFYDLRHRTVAEQIVALATAGTLVDPVTLGERLRATGVADAHEILARCQDLCHSPAHFPAWRETLTGKLTLRRIIQTAQEAQAAATRNGRAPAEILDDYERDVLAIRHGNAASNGEVDVRATLLELTAEYERAVTEGRPLGILTGFVDLDRILGGLKPQQLCIVAARPSVGKTSLALNIAERVAVDSQQPVGFVSLEMSGKELVHRLACSRARVDSVALTNGKASEQDIARVVEAHRAIAKAPLRLCDRGGLTLAQLTAHGRRMVQRHHIELLIVDYLGLLRSGEKGRSRYEETTLVSNALKTLAKELNLPVITLAQLNRDTEREERPPRMSDLRDSGALEQDADIIALLHREDADDSDTQPVKLIVAKQRNGRTGSVSLVFRRAFTRFEAATVGQ